MVEAEDVANWVTGRLEVFFEGSWSQVCAGDFGPPDARVACRQLGFGSGTVVPAELPKDYSEFADTVFPEVALTGLQCKGTEERLLDCTTNPFDGSGIGCRTTGFDSSGGLVLGCVDTPVEGETLTSAHTRLHATDLTFIHIDEVLRQCMRCTAYLLLTRSSFNTSSLLSTRCIHRPGVAGLRKLTRRTKCSHIPVLQSMVSHIMMVWSEVA